MDSVWGALCYRVFVSFILFYVFFIFMYTEAYSEALDVQNQHAFQIAEKKECIEKKST